MSELQRGSPKRLASALLIGKSGRKRGPSAFAAFQTINANRLLALAARHHTQGIEKSLQRTANAPGTWSCRGHLVVDSNSDILYSKGVAKLLLECFRVGVAHPERDQGPHVPKHRLADRERKLVDVLVGNGEA